jgi:hypothetical protein
VAIVEVVFKRQQGRAQGQGQGQGQHHVGEVAPPPSSPPSPRAVSREGGGTCGVTEVELGHLKVLLCQVGVALTTCRRSAEASRRLRDSNREIRGTLVPVPSIALCCFVRVVLRAVVLCTLCFAWLCLAGCVKCAVFSVCIVLVSV